MQRHPSGHHALYELCKLKPGILILRLGRNVIQKPPLEPQQGLGAQSVDKAAYRHCLGLKAAGGIANLDDARDFVALGADRLGTSRIVKAVKAMEQE